MNKLILGSASPRRLALLEQVGITPDAIVAADIDESPRKKERPRDYCRRMAIEKAQAISAQSNDLILCADTIVTANLKILGKPVDAQQAIATLRLLSGRRHRVITAIALRCGEKIWQRDVVTIVRMKRLTDEEIDDYIASNEWQGKAGSYAIQGRAGAFVQSINGSYSSVVGLPLAETLAILRLHS